MLHGHVSMPTLRDGDWELARVQLIRHRVGECCVLHEDGEGQGTGFTLVVDCGSVCDGGILKVGDTSNGGMGLRQNCAMNFIMLPWSMVAFTSGVEHEVKEITAGLRWVDLLFGALWADIGAG